MVWCAPNREIVGSGWMVRVRAGSVMAGRTSSDLESVDSRRLEASLMPIGVQRLKGTFLPGQTVVDGGSTAAACRLGRVCRPKFESQAGLCRLVKVAVLGGNGRVYPFPSGHQAEVWVSAVFRCDQSVVSRVVNRPGPAKPRGSPRRWCEVTW